MPYIKTSRRETLLPPVERLCWNLIENDYAKGDVNYAITKLLIGYIKHHGKSYDTISNALAVLADVDHEFRRRVLDGYEDGKCSDNGEVFTI